MSKALKKWGFLLWPAKLSGALLKNNNAVHYNHLLPYLFYPALSFLCCFSYLAFSQKPVFALTKEWESSLTSLLDTAVYLQKAFYGQAERQISLSSTKMTYQISQLEKSSYFLPYHQHFYIKNLLQKLKPPLEALMTQKSQGAENIKLINQTLIYMANMYGLNKYVIFFCPKDRSVWMQKNGIKIQKVSYLSSSSCQAVPTH